MQNLSLMILHLHLCSVATFEGFWWEMQRKGFQYFIRYLDIIIKYTSWHHISEYIWYIWIQSISIFYQISWHYIWIHLNTTEYKVFQYFIRYLSGHYISEYIWIHLNTNYFNISSDTYLDIIYLNTSEYIWIHIYYF